MKATKMKKTPALLTASIDQGAVLRQLDVVGDELAEIVEKVEETPMTVEDEDDYKVACALLLATVVKRKKISTWKEGFMIKVKELVAYVEKEFAPRETDAKTAETYFRDAVCAYALKRDSDAAALREAAAHLGDRDAAKADAMREEANAVARPPKVPGISLRPKLVVEIFDEKKLPKKFWKSVVDVAAVEAALDANEKVPGARGKITFGVTVTPSNNKEIGV